MVYYGIRYLTAAALSPNGKYVLIVTLEYIYLYEIAKHRNIKIWKNLYNSYLA